MSYLDDRRAHIFAGRPLPEKKIKFIKQVSDKRQKKHDEQKELLRQAKENHIEGSGPIVIVTSLDQWFSDRMTQNEPVCAECGSRADWVKLPGYEKVWKACQAHILPKKKMFGFPSIATNPYNHVVLFPSFGGKLCGCHGFYDSGWYNASTMKIWKSIVDIFITKLYPIIPESEKKNIPEALRNEIK